MSKPGAGWASIFQVGKGKTLAIPMSVHDSNRRKVIQMFKDKNINSGIILLQGGEERNQYDTDTGELFRQDSWFNYLFGVKEPGIYGAICISTGKTILFIPKLSDDYRIWCGEIRPPSDFKESYAVDEVYFIEQLSDWIATTLLAIDNTDSLPDNNNKIHLLEGINTDSGSKSSIATFINDQYYKEQNRIECNVLYNILAHCRVTKSNAEIDVMRYCAYVASNAHVELMRAAANNACTFEYEYEALFLHEIYRKGGCRRCAYTCIGACGPNAAVLHYGHAGAPNDRILKASDMALFDMGAEYHGYVSDITCSFPLSGKFTADQRAIYECVLCAQKAVLEYMYPGNLWTDCHKLAELEIIKGLLQIGILCNGTPEELALAHVGAVFFPHGLGHLIGCDTHDVGGYLPDTPLKIISVPGLNKLRTSRMLEVGMVLTNEPGCYFIDALLDAALNDPMKAKYINEEVLSRFRGFGGVRLEDVVLVTSNGPDSLSTCPRTIEEIEGVMSGGIWPPQKDTATYLRRHWTKLAPHGYGMEDIKL